MQRWKKPISLFLLAVFSLVVLPASLVHEFFADHKDAQENHCRFYHKDLGRHVEQQEEHCAIFKTDTPLYDAVKISHTFKISLVVISEYKTVEISTYSFSKPLNLPARAPPLA